ncbi:MAG: aminopeptidase P N-terminal domain-containing protein [Candidatus Atribacteria bacterium]|nr:aminopeptidase P N-terminal domain-containing protein [Candidatus Atribacteria bacterium]
MTFITEMKKHRFAQTERRVRIILVFTLALTSALLSAQPAGQGQPGRSGATLEAANAPAVAARRAKLMEAHKDAVIIIPSQFKARDGMRDNLNFIYLTGLQEPEAVLVLDPSGNPRETLFRQRAGGPGGPAASIGTMGAGGTGAGRTTQGQPGIGAVAVQGPAPSDPGLVEKPVAQLSPALRGVSMSGRLKRVFLPFSDLDFLSRTFGTSNPLAQSEAILNVDPTLLEMRLTKDTDEIQALREAIDLTAEALNEAFRAAEPGFREVDLAAILRYAFDKRETKDSFLQAASGPNSTNVHFGATARALAAGDLVVFDVGAYIRGYTSDISRTIPANGRFTKEQRAIYGLVLEAENEGCRRLISGVTFKAVQTEVEDILMAGLEKLGLVTDVKSPWQRRLYIQHGFGHGIGLDVHDAWSWHSPRLDKVAMAPGMVMTMEPGLYFPEVRFEAFLEALKGKVPDAELAVFAAKVRPVYKRYAGIGVRIEDDILITATGNEILSGRVPKEIADIEKLMREKSPHNLLK